MEKIIKRINIDTEFNEITETKVLNNINKAFNSLDYNTRTLEEDIRKDMIEKKAGQMKETINSYIDWRAKKPYRQELKGELK